MSDVLGKIVEATLRALASEPFDEKAMRGRARAAADQREHFRFSSALRREGPADRIRLIAEIKSASPSAGSILEHPDIERIAAEYRDGGAAALSVVTEPRFFRGSREWIARAAASGLPVIMKDFVVEPSQLLGGVAAGAEAVLLLASLLEASRIRDFIAILGEFGCDALVEVHDERELERAIEGGARMVGVNNRDLRDFSVDLATSERLIPNIPPAVVKVSESGIGTAEDARRLRDAGFDAILVGESLLRQSDRRRGVSELLGA